MTQPLAAQDSPSASIQPHPKGTAGALAEKFRWVRRPNLPRFVAPYAVVLILTLLAMTWTLQLWRLDITSPLCYNGDAMQHLMFTKGFIENGWYLRNPMLGAPFEMEMYEFPAADTLPGLIIKFLGLFSHDPALVTNVFFLLTFPLASLCAFFACRQIGIRTGPAMLSSVLYAFLPYHFFRNTSHLYLSAYFVAPLAVLVAWWVASGHGGGSEHGWRQPSALWSPWRECTTLFSPGFFWLPPASWLCLPGGIGGISWREALCAPC